MTAAARSLPAATMQLTDQKLPQMSREVENSGDGSSTLAFHHAEMSDLDPGDSSDETSPTATEDGLTGTIDLQSKVGPPSGPMVGAIRSAPTMQDEISASTMEVKRKIRAGKRRCAEDNVDSGCELDEAEEPKPTKKARDGELPVATRAGASPFSPFRSPPRRFPVKRYEHRVPPVWDRTFTRNGRNLRSVIPRIIPQAGEVPDEFEYKTQGRTADWATYKQNQREDALEKHMIESDPSQVGILNKAMEAGIQRRESGNGCRPCAYNCHLFASRPCKHLENTSRKDPQTTPQNSRTRACLTRGPVPIPPRKVVRSSNVMVPKEAAAGQQSLLSRSNQGDRASGTASGARARRAHRMSSAF